MSDTEEQADESASKPKFVIWAASWKESIGGVIALHTLCARLNELGYQARLWPETKKLLSFRTLPRYIRYYQYRLFHGKKAYSFGPFPNQIASRKDLRDSVIVYPEIIAGNPLRGKRVVRWLLHRPGFHTGQVCYGPEDRIFFYGEGFYDPALGDDKDNLLRVTYVNHTYRQTNFGRRSGSCVLIRKGHDRPLNKHPADAIAIDALSHEEKAAIFNQVQYLYSYDRYTFYNVFAAICGAVPVYLPADDEAEPDWSITPRPVGLAYGVDDVDRAVATIPELLNWVKSHQEEEVGMIERFVQKCRIENWRKRG